jgi:23S rRNA (guanosine2251-2'-O)-methyltransferase
MQRGMYDRITKLCGASGIPYGTADARVLDAMTDGQVHQGVVATIAATEMLGLHDALALLPPAPEPALAVLFDHIQDPHNLGAMIRTAEAVGAVFAAVPLRRGSLPTGTVVKTSAGASLRFPIASVGNVANAVRETQEAGLWCIGLDAGAERSIYSAGIPARALLVVGAEGRGLTKTTASACDELLRIPIKGGAGSLNASVALGVAMFEWFAKRQESAKAAFAERRGE